MLRARFVIALTCVLLVLGALWIGCASSECADNLDCPKPQSDGSSESSMPDTTTPVLDASDAADVVTTIDGCVIKDAPKEHACVLQDAIGIFVAALGNDGNPGTEDRPVATVARAVTLARAANKPSVFICGGAYGEAIVLTQGPGVNLFGGLACPTLAAGDAGSDAGDAGDAGAATDAGQWAWTGVQTKFAPSTPGIALLVDQLSSGTTIADLEVQAQSAIAPGSSSIAAHVRNCSSVVFQRVTMRAGDGAMGAMGATGNFGDVAAASGTNNIGTAGGVAVVCPCMAGGSSTGAAGGMGGGAATAGGSGAPNLGGSAPKNGEGGAPAATNCSNGNDGADGRPGDGGIASATNGSLVFAGWQPAAGARGIAGGTAQGGGGGGGALLAGSGGGGCGGCGGQGGATGMSGGSSFALLVFQSGVTLDSCTLFAANGAAGGQGGTGQASPAGAGGGTGACSGGAGGAGGTGGGGSGGAGGLSIAIGYSGTAPITNATSLQIGGSGAAGLGGVGPGPNGTGESGKPGVAMQTLLLP